MTTKTQNMLDPQQIKLYNQLCGLEKKEKQIYKALAALITYINGEKLEWEPDDFNKFKKGVLATIGDLAVIREKKKKRPHMNLNLTSNITSELSFRPPMSLIAIWQFRLPIKI